MPRIYDFVKSSPYRPVRLAEQKVSAEEIHPLQILAEKRRNLQGRHYQFTAILIPDKRLFQQTMSQAYGWLSQRGAGPFHWHEGEKHNGHGLEVKVHFEQLPDIRAFKEMWGPAFQYEKDTDFHLENLAAIKGVLPVRGSVTQWALEHGVKVEFDHVAQGVMVIALLSGITHLLHRQWITPSSDVIPSDPSPTPVPSVPTPSRLPVPETTTSRPTPPPTTTRQEPTRSPTEPSAASEWEKLQESTDRHAFAAFLKKHPKSPYADNAAFSLGRLELMDMTERRDLEGLRAFVDRHKGNRKMSDWVYVAEERIPQIEHERDEAAVQRITGRLRDIFASKDLAALRTLSPDLTASESEPIARMFSHCKSVELIWGRGGAYVNRGKPVAEINQELEVRVVTNEGETLRARRNWVRMDVEKVNGAWMLKKARWQQGGGKSNFSAFNMPELP